MVDQNNSSAKIQMTLQKTEKDEVEPDKVRVPKEYRSKNGMIKVIIDGPDVSIVFDGKIAEDIGCYRNIKNLSVKFSEGKGPSIIPQV